MASLYGGLLFDRMLKPLGSEANDGWNSEKGDGTGKLMMVHAPQKHGQPVWWFPVV